MKKIDFIIIFYFFVRFSCQIKNIKVKNSKTNTNKKGVLKCMYRFKDERDIF